MNEYRCTRNSPYGDRCPGYLDIKARQGHYIQANSPLDAIGIMSERFPNDTMGFTATLWRDESRQLVN